jgi:hypothetical protein
MPAAPEIPAVGATSVLGSFLRRFWARGLAAVLIAASGVGLGYALHPDTDRPAVTGLAATAPHATAPALQRNQGAADIARADVAMLRDSLARAGGELAALRTERGQLMAAVARARRAAASARIASAPAAADGAAPRAAVTSDRLAASIGTEGTSEVRPVEAVELRSVRNRTVVSSQERSSMSSGDPLPLAPDAAAPIAESARWRVGVNNYFRLSLPRVYSVTDRGTIATDREIDASYRFGGNASGMLTSLRIGAAAGQTTFGQVFYETDASTHVNTVIEQHPSLFYGRVYIAPEIFRSGIISGDLDLGVGGTSIGPLLTVGSNVDVETDATFGPFDGIGTSIGASSWILWTQTGGRSYMSTNLNIQIGAALRF